MRYYLELNVTLYYVINCISNNSYIVNTQNITGILTDFYNKNIKI